MNSYNNKRGRISWSNYEPFGIRFKQTYNALYPPKRNNVSNFDVLESAPADYWEETQRGGYFLESFAMFDPSFPYAPEGDYMPGSAQPPASLNSIQYYLTKKIWIPFLEMDNRNENGQRSVRKTFKQTTIADEFAALMNSFNQLANSINADNRGSNQVAPPAQQQGLAPLPPPIPPPLAIPPRVRPVVIQGPTRQQIRADLDAIKLALQQQINKGDITQAQANVTLQKEIKRLRPFAKAVGQIEAQGKAQQKQIETLQRSVDTLASKGITNVANAFDEKQLVSDLQKMVKKEVSAVSKQITTETVSIDWTDQNTKLKDLHDQVVDVSLKLKNVQNALDTQDPFAIKGLQTTLDKLKKDVAALSGSMAKYNKVGQGKRSNSQGTVMYNNNNGPPPGGPGGGGILAGGITLEQLNEALKPIKTYVEAEEEEKKKQAALYVTPPPIKKQPPPSPPPMKLKAGIITPLKNEIGDLKLALASVRKNVRAIKTTNKELKDIKDKVNNCYNLIAEIPTFGLKNLIEPGTGVLTRLQAIDLEIAKLDGIEKALQKNQNTNSNQEIIDAFNSSLLKVNKNLKLVFDKIDEVAKQSKDTEDAITGFYQKWDDDKPKIKAYQKTLKEQIQTLNSGTAMLLSKVGTKSELQVTVDNVNRDVQKTLTLLAQIQQAESELEANLGVDLAALKTGQITNSFATYFKNMNNPLKLAIDTVQEKVEMNTTQIALLDLQLKSQAKDLELNHKSLLAKLNAIVTANTQNNANSLYVQIKSYLGLWLKAIGSAIKGMQEIQFKHAKYSTESGASLMQNQQNILNEITAVMKGLDTMISTFNVAQNTADQKEMEKIATALQPPQLNDLDLALAKSLTLVKNGDDIENFNKLDIDDTEEPIEEKKEPAGIQLAGLSDEEARLTRKLLGLEDEPTMEIDDDVAMAITKQQAQMNEIFAAIDQAEPIKNAVPNMRKQISQNKKQIDTITTALATPTKPGALKTSKSVAESISMEEEEEEEAKGPDETQQFMATVPPLTGSEVFGTTEEEKAAIEEKKQEEQETEFKYGKDLQNVTVDWSEINNEIYALKGPYTRFSDDALKKLNRDLDDLNQALDEESNGVEWSLIPINTNKKITKLNGTKKWAVMKGNTLQKINPLNVPLVTEITDKVGLNPDQQDFLNYLQICYMTNAAPQAFEDAGYKPPQGWKQDSLAAHFKVPQKTINTIINKFTGNIPGGIVKGKLTPYNILKNYFLTTNESTGKSFNEWGLRTNKNKILVTSHWFTKMGMSKPTEVLFWFRMYSMANMGLFDQMIQLPPQNPFMVFMDSFVNKEYPVIADPHTGKIDFKPDPKLLSSY